MLAARWYYAGPELSAVWLDWQTLEWIVGRNGERSEMPKVPGQDGIASAHGRRRNRQIREPWRLAGAARLVGQSTPAALPL